MDPKVYGKLLMHHRRGNGVDVESPPIGRREMSLDGISRVQKVSWLPLMFLGYKSIYRQKKYISGATTGPREWGARLPPGMPSCLVASSWSSRLRLQVFWIAFGPRKILAMVSSVWTPFDIPFLQNSKIGKKQKLALGLRLVG